jgi:hypothetical protein
MFGRRPRYDDTFGVRMDLGADRVEPMAMRPGAQVRVKETILIERPGSIFGGFARRETDPLAALRAKPERERKAPPREPRPATAPRTLTPDQGPRTFEGVLRAIWQRLTVVQRIGLSVFAGWFLIASGLWVVAAVIAVVWFTRRQRAG